jgi:hypothetical protein
MAPLLSAMRYLQGLAVDGLAMQAELAVMRMPPFPLQPAAVSLCRLCTSCALLLQVCGTGLLLGGQ